MRALLVDDHAVFRTGLRTVLAGFDAGIEFAEAAGVEEALARRDGEDEGDDYDLILLDLTLKGLCGLAALRAIRAAFEAPVVIVSDNEDPALIWQAIGEGACGFIPKGTGLELLSSALRFVLAGGIYLPKHALYWQHRRLRPEPAARAGLTGRRLAVLLQAVQGKCNKSIARELRVSESTVKAHLSAAFQTLGVQNRTEAAYEVARQQLGAVTARD